MDELFASLSRTLLDDFHVTTASSMRQDQWYKRCMEFWRESDSGDVLVLTPKNARAEWAPRIYSFAKNLADVTRRASHQERDTASKKPLELIRRHDRVFDDPTIVKDPPSCFFDGEEGRLGYAEQNLSYWITSSGEAAQGPLPQRACGVKKLLERHESRGLLALGMGHGQILRTLAELPPPKRSQRQGWEAPQGWTAALDDTLEVLLFIMIMLCFEDQLLTNHDYARWLPAIRKYPVHPAVWTYLGNQGFSGIESRHPQAAGINQQKLKDHLDWHLRTLSIGVMVMDECSIEHSPSLEDRIVNAFLQLVGFEAWNREREGGEGRWYLECKLNQGKSAKWLRSQVPGEKEDGFEDGQSSAEFGDKAQRLPQSKKDPLKLMKPGQNKIEDLEEEEEEEVFDNEEAAKLAATEVEEAQYGKKRSLKYRRKGHDSVTS
ncbi:hypothetical protein PG993_004335 [Apiospora rasikravindrae]|uniref:Uncharacterized protein n=1 Tax=Apiospora rasikravindrae TaxID=990691 RepID=A0ABR1TCG5_9PEZI